MKTIIDWVKAHWSIIKKGLIGLGILLLLLSFVSNWVQSDRYQQIKKDHKELKAQKKLLEHQKDSLDKIYKASQLVINALNAKSDSIKKATDKIIADMRHKEDEYLQTIADLKNVPPDTVYKRIFAYNPNTNNDLLRYPFGATQIKNIYSDHLALNYNLGLVGDLNKTLGLCNTDNQVKSGIIVQKDKQIGSLSGQVKINDGMITTLNADNKVLTKSYKGERRWKIIWRTASLIEAGGLGYLILTK